MGFWLLTFSHVIPGLIHSHCRETLTESAGRPARLLSRVKVPFVQFFYLYFQTGKL